MQALSYIAFYRCMLYTTDHSPLCDYCSLYTMLYITYSTPECYSAFPFTTKYILQTAALFMLGYTSPSLHSVCITIHTVNRTIKLCKLYRVLSSYREKIVYWTKDCNLLTDLLIKMMVAVDNFDLANNINTEMVLLFLYAFNKWQLRIHLLQCILYFTTRSTLTLPSSLNRVICSSLGDSPLQN